ncbi:MAG: hypothetical protein FWC50_16155, partial [Planctomycetaceae bacterium]|nr:hypothetical protein [Planctomycetaceae bacterium]
EIAMPLEETLPTGVILTSDDVPSAAKLDPSFANGYWDENLYAFLADMQVREQRKNDNFFGENETDDWLAEFENLALLELRK